MRATLLLACTLALATELLGQTPPPGTETADWVSRQVDARDIGRDGRLDMAMRLFDRQGRARERALTVTTLRGRGDAGDRVLVRFTAPNDIKGTGFLVWEHDAVDDERFLWLPALGRVRRIAGSEKQESFVGSDLSLRRHRRPRARRLHLQLCQPRRRLDRAGWHASSRLATRVAGEGQGRGLPANLSLVRKDNVVVCRSRSSIAVTNARSAIDVRRLERVRRHLDGDGCGDDERAPTHAHGAHDHARRVQRGPDGGGLQPARARTGLAMTPPAVGPAARLADVLYRFRFPLSALVLVGALWFAPSANITNIDNDLSAWISKDDPTYQDYERFRDEFGGTRNLIVALESDRLFTPRRPRATSSGLPASSRRSIGSSACKAWRQPTSSVRSQPTTDDDGGIEVAPLIEERAGSIDGAAAVKREALDDPLMRGDLVSEDGRVTAVVVTFDEDRIDEVRGKVLDDIRGIVERDKPQGLETYYNGSLEISETYNRVTLSNTQDLTPPILIITILAIVRAVPVGAQDRRDPDCHRGQRDLDPRPVRRCRVSRSTS